MSENIEPAAPQSTQDIAASVIQEAETQDAPPSKPPRLRRRRPRRKRPTRRCPPPKNEACAKLAIPRKRIDGRDNLIPWSRVAKIIEKGITEGRGDFGQKYQKLTTTTNP
jgi:hypothetical protein